jgi:hypothetical protein
MADQHDDEWCGTQEAARRLGVTPAAVRNRIKRRTIEVRPDGNIGRQVRVPRTVSSTLPSTDPVPDPEHLPGPVAALIAELRDRIAELQAERTSLRQEMAQERAAAAQERVALQEAVGAQVKALADLADELRRDRDEWRRAPVMTVPSVAPRRPWWRRLAG